MKKEDTVKLIRVKKKAPGYQNAMAPLTSLTHAEAFVFGTAFFLIYFSFRL